MSAYRRIADVVQGDAECTQMTQSVNREFFCLDLFGLVSPSDLGLETIRNQTLPRAITDEDALQAAEFCHQALPDLRHRGRIAIAVSGDADREDETSVAFLRSTLID